MLEPCLASKRDCCQRWLRDTCVGSDQQPGACTERKRKVKCTRCIAGEESATTMTSPSHLFLPPLPLRFFRRFPGQLWDLPESMRTFIVYVQPSTFKPSLIPPLDSSLRIETTRPTSSRPCARIDYWMLRKKTWQKLHQKIKIFTFLKIKNLEGSPN